MCKVFYQKKQHDFNSVNFKCRLNGAFFNDMREIAIFYTEKLVFKIILRGFFTSEVSSLECYFFTGVCGKVDLFPQQVSK